MDNHGKNVVDNISLLTDDVTKTKKVSRSKHSKHQVESDSDADSDEIMSSSSDEEDEVHVVKRKKPKQGNVWSGQHDKLSDTKLIPNEWYAHTALDETMGGEWEFSDLSFNLLVVGELEIIGSAHISRKEVYSRIKLLKKLAYKYEVMSLKDVLMQYVSFISKVEKGKFKWGSKKDLASFEQQLMYTMSLNRALQEPSILRIEKGKSKSSGKDDRKKYCLDYNKGTCKFQGPHGGLLNGTTVIKHHICKKCLMEEGLERSLPSKDCVKK